MAGQGTAAVEVLEDVSNLDVVICPVGGGGLLCGTAVAAKSIRPEIKVVAAEPVNADDAAQSFHAGRLIHSKKKFTIADGLRTNVGAPNFAIDRKSTRLNSSHLGISYAVFCLKKKNAKPVAHSIEQV